MSIVSFEQTNREDLAMQIADFQICIVALLVPLCYDRLQRKAHAGNLRPSLSTTIALHSTLRYVDLSGSVICSSFEHNHTITEEKDLDVCTLFSLSLSDFYETSLGSSGNSRNVSLCSTGTSFRLFFCEFHACYKFA